MKSPVYSLHVGLNSVDATKFNGWAGILGACQRDAAGLCQAAITMGSEAIGLLTGAAKPDFMPTCDNWRKAMTSLAAKANAGDTVFITHSGHGGSDYSGQFLVFYDGVIYEEEFRSYLAKFRVGVKVVVVLDSCHSGGLDRAFLQPPNRAVPYTFKHNSPPPDLRGSPSILASVALFCACLPEQTASDGDEFGAWTGSLIYVWNNPICYDMATGKRFGTWREWFTNAVNVCPKSQTPVLRLLGQNQQFIDDPAQFFA